MQERRRDQLTENDMECTKYCNYSFEDFVWMECEAKVKAMCFKEAKMYLEIFTNLIQKVSLCLGFFVIYYFLRLFLRHPFLLLCKCNKHAKQ